jgi:hypothetical protein
MFISAAATPSRNKRKLGHFKEKENLALLK